MRDNIMRASFDDADEEDWQDKAEALVRDCTRHWWEFLALYHESAFLAWPLPRGLDVVFVAELFWGKISSFKYRNFLLEFSGNLGINQSLLTPFISGTCGFLRAGEHLLDFAQSRLQLSSSGEPPRLFIEGVELGEAYRILGYMDNYERTTHENHR